MDELNQYSNLNDVIDYVNTRDQENLNPAGCCIKCFCKEILTIKERINQIEEKFSQVCFIKKD